MDLCYKLAGKLAGRREVVSDADVNKHTRISDDELQRGLDELNDMLNWVKCYHVMTAAFIIGVDVLLLNVRIRPYTTC